VKDDGYKNFKSGARATWFYPARWDACVGRLVGMLCLGTPGWDVSWDVNVHSIFVFFFFFF